MPTEGSYDYAHTSGLRNHINLLNLHQLRGRRHYSWMRALDEAIQIRNYRALNTKYQVISISN